MLLVPFWFIGSLLLGSLWALIGWQLSHPRSAARHSATGRAPFGERFAHSLADDILDRVETPQLLG